MKPSPAPFDFSQLDFTPPQEDDKAPFDFGELDFVPPSDNESSNETTKNHKPIYTLDLETDPFQYGRNPQPFAAGLYTGTVFHGTWGKDCISKMREIVKRLEPGIIYMHNGGKFDIYHMMDWIVGFPALIINGRIVKTQTQGFNGLHEIRDSLAILPFALSKYKKDEIDYSIMESNTRNKHKREIMAYLRGDCVYLHELVSAFVDMFGAKLTVGSTAMHELKKFHSFENLGGNCDADIRDKFYYGGRVECFKTGVLKGDWKVYDVNSMYPFVMANFLHPIDTPEADTIKIRKSTCFVTVEGKNYGAFPTRVKGEGLRFDVERGTFHVSIHEYNTAIRCGLFEPVKIKRCVNFRRRDSFKKFVHTFYEQRNKAKAIGDSIHALFFKYILNSAYGKFAQNPNKYLEYTITNGNADLRSDGWTPESTNEISDNENYTVWFRPSQDEIKRFFNVATGASITGAARAVLMEAINKSVNPIYCDTDSLICESLETPHNDTELGAWKLEATGTKACIGRKKLYALFDGNECVKYACKGVKITPEQIEQICNGATITSTREAPSYHLDGSITYISRKVKM